MSKGEPRSLYDMRRPETGSCECKSKCLPSWLPRSHWSRAISYPVSWRRLLLKPPSNLPIGWLMDRKEEKEKNPPLRGNVFLQNRKQLSGLTSKLIAGCFLPGKFSDYFRCWQIQWLRQWPLCFPRTAQLPLRPEGMLTACGSSSISNTTLSSPSVWCFLNRQGPIFFSRGQDP